MKVLAAAIFLGVIGLAAGLSSVRADGPALSEAESCGRTFLEIEGQNAGSINWAGYGQEFDTLWGLPAYSNGTNVNAACYQCTEAVHRFVRYMYGVPSYYCGRPVMGNARYVARNLDRLLGHYVRSTPRIAPYKVRMVNFFNGTSLCRPVVGAVVSLEIFRNQTPCDLATGVGGICEDYTEAKAYELSEGAGHVAVLRSLEKREDGVWEGDLFAQHGRMYSAGEKNRDAPISSGRVRFRQDKEGHWFGWWWTPKSGGGLVTSPRPVVSWTNPLIVSKGADEDDLMDLPVETACTIVAPASGWAQGCEQIRASRSAD